MSLLPPTTTSTFVPSKIQSLSFTSSSSSSVTQHFKGKVGVGGGGGYRWSCRKPGVHPEFYEDAKVYCNGEHVMTTGGTQKEYKVDVWSGNHPFYLGNRSASLLEDDQVEKFRKKYGDLGRLMEIPVLKYGEIVLPSKKKKAPAKGKGKK